MAMDIKEAFDKKCEELENALIELKLRRAECVHLRKKVCELSQDLMKVNSILLDNKSD